MNRGHVTRRRINPLSEGKKHGIENAIPGDRGYSLSSHVLRRTARCPHDSLLQYSISDAKLYSLVRRRQLHGRPGGCRCYRGPFGSIGAFYQLAVDGTRILEARETPVKICFWGSSPDTRKPPWIESCFFPVLYSRRNIISFSRNNLTQRYGSAMKCCNFSIVSTR